MKLTLLWEAQTLDGISENGIIRNSSRLSAKQSLQDQGYFQIKITSISEKVYNSPLSGKEVIELFDSLLLMLDSGVSIAETLEMLIHDKKSIVSHYIYHCLRDSLHQGSSLKSAFEDLNPLFSEFFVSMIALSEKSGDLRNGLRALKEFYQSKESMSDEIKKLTRYPKIVLGITVLITLGVITFIVPMFENIYSLYEGDLPIVTRLMMVGSDFIHQYWMQLILVFVIFAVWANLPYIRRFQPWVFIKDRISRFRESQEDPYLYAHAMKILLESGQPVKSATQHAAGCMSEKNQVHGVALTDRLNAGLTFTEAFKELPWFPAIFPRFLASAERAGMLQVGFEQVFRYINRQRTNQFNKWSKFLEPSLMLVLGSIVLVILLSIYLPIFDLGNQIR